MGSMLRRRIGAGWVGSGLWIILALTAAAADETTAVSPDKDAPQPSSAPPAAFGADSAASGGEKRGPTLAPPRKESTKKAAKEPSKDAPSRGDARDAEPKREPARASGALTLMVDGDRPPSDAEDSAGAKAAGSKRPASAVPEAPASESAAAGQPAGGAASDAKTLQPIPEEAAAAAIEIETASFSRVTPGTSTLEDVKKHWGVAKEIRKQQGAIVYLYAVDPFDQVEVMFYEGKLTSIIIRLNGTFDADAVARQLSLSKIRPVYVSNELGEILGQSYPERGVLFSFAPGPAPDRPSMKVAQIILEPVTVEPFVLRAETDLESQTESSLKDIEVAVKMAPANARARWLQARALVLLGETGKALPAIQEAVRLEPNNAQYHLTQAQILGRLGRFREAAEGAENAVAMSDQRPHIKVRALCLLGDLASSGPQPDYKRAMQHHGQAVKMAEALTGDPHPAVRQPAKEVLVDAHLGAAQDIAWGNWNNKEIAVAAWLKRASEFADDLIQNDGGAGEIRFRVATRALAACVGLQGKMDPTPWADQATRVGQELVQGTASPAHKLELQREVGLALYDAVQVFQMRNERPAAEKFGKLATEFLEATRPSKDRPADLYLLGRLYFRMGAIRASGESNHRAAVEWFDKAVAALQDAAPQVSSSERGRLGETFVSMGVSYWETSQRDKAVQLTRQGVEMMEKAVQDGSLTKTALDVAYNNLATMHRQLGQNDQAKVYAEKVSRQ